MSVQKLVQAEALFHAGKPDQAKAIVQRVLQASPADPEANNLMALMLQATQDAPRALYFAERAYLANRADWRFANNYAMLLTRTGKPARAAEVLDAAVRLHPDQLDLRLGYANALSIDSRFVDAADQCAASLALAPDDPRIASSLISTLIEMGRSADAVALARDAASRHPDHIPLASQLAHALNYLPGVPREDVLAAHRAFGDLLARKFPSLSADDPSFRGSRDPERPLRVAILSGDLRTHSVAYFIEPFLEHHDRTSIQLFAYHTAADDAVSERLKRHAHAWRGCAGIPDHVLAERVRADGIDVAIELSGHTCAATLLAMHRRVAPVQATYLGYPNTTGLPAVDWRLVDHHTDPPGAEPWCVERLLRLDPCFLCYRPHPDAPPVAPPPSQRPREGHPAGDGIVRFGSFNAVAKLSPDVMRLWARIVQRVPNSRLLLKASSFLDPKLRDEIASRLASWGMPSHALTILPPQPASRDHLDAYREIDVALDPFPYHGTTTTCEAMWMGVPVVTLAGNTHASRVGVSLLSALDLPDQIAASPDEYVERAVALATDPARLASLRASLRERFARSVLRDEIGFARRLEAAVRAMWQNRHATPPLKR